MGFRTHRQRTQGYIKELEKEVLSFKKENSDLKRMVSLLQETLLENNISLPEGFQSPEGFASPPDLKMSPSPAVQVNLTSLAEVKAQKVSSSEAPAYQTPTSIAMDLDSNFGSAADPYGIEDNPFVTVDLTGLASTPSHKWCSTKAVTGGVPVFEPPDNTYRDPFGQEDEHVEKPAPTLTCQAAMDFVLEYVRFLFVFRYTFLLCMTITHDVMQTRETLLPTRQVPIF
jgi:hypothetical protein